MRLARRARAGLPALLLALAAACGAGGVGGTGGAFASEPAPAEPPPSALRLLLPGPLEDAALVSGGDRSVLAVVLGGSGETDEGRAPRRVYLYEPSARTLLPRGEALPDGAPELMAGAAGRLWVGLARYGALGLVPVRGGSHAGPPPPEGPGGPGGPGGAGGAQTGPPTGAP
ncbi:MAG: hypothetical protein ACLF0P_17650, partial [Thermoanaerobaculia bacterium]